MAAVRSPRYFRLWARFDFATVRSVMSAMGRHVGWGVRRVAIWLFLGTLVGLVVPAWWIDNVLVQPVAARVDPTSDLMRVDSPIVEPADPPTSSPRPANILALTFDGGPDPTWTPIVLTWLSVHQVRATFFLDGTSASRQPDLVRRIAAEGHEIGTVGLSGDHLDQRDRADRRRRIDLAQLMIAGITGQVPRAIRLSRATSPELLDDEELAVLEVLHPEERLVMSDRSMRPARAELSAVDLADDLIGPGRTASVVAIPAPGIQTSRVIRALDAAASDIPARGLRFGMVSEFEGRPVQGLSPSASRGTRSAGTALLWLITIERFLAEWIGFLVGFVLVASVGRASVGAMLALRHRRRERRRIDPELQESFDRAVAMGAPGPSVSILIPARNESTVIEAAISDVVAAARRLTGSWEIIVIDDASSDATAGLADRALRAAIGGAGIGSGRVVTGPGVGKARALDAGLAFAVGELVVMLDADSSPDLDALVHLIRAFADPGVGAVCGRMRVGNPHGPLAWCQVVEYAMANAIERRMFSELGVMSCVPGAIGAYRRSALDQIGPIPADTIAEDTDLTLTLQRAGWRVEFEPRSNATTLVPTGLRSFWNQRLRWATGILQNVAKHRGMFCRSTRGDNGGRVAWLLPYLCVFGGLSILGPVVDATALVALLTGSFRTSLTIVAIITAMSTALTALALHIERLPMRYLLVVPLMTLVLRPILYAAQIRATMAIVGGIAIGWRPNRDSTGRDAIDLRDLPSIDQCDERNVTVMGDVTDPTSTGAAR